MYDLYPSLSTVGSGALEVGELEGVTVSAGVDAGVTEEDASEGVGVVVAESSACTTGMPLKLTRAKIRYQINIFLSVGIILFIYFIYYFQFYVLCL